MDKIICVGKNYPAHADELGEKQPEKPVLFLKPASTLTELRGQALELSYAHGEIHHELEIVFRLTIQNGHPEFSHFTLGLDLTKRDLQTNLKKSGQPWEIAKVFRHSALIGRWLSFKDWEAFSEQPFSLTIQNQIRQTGLSSQMFFSPNKCLELAASYFAIFEGDLLFTGTPKGVGPLRPKDQVLLSWKGQELGQVTIS